MKMNYSFRIVLIFALIILAVSCSKDNKAASPTDCIDDKIEAFALESYAQAVYEVETPSGTQYLFQHSCADCGDHVYNANCEEVCITNLEGYDPGVVPCEQSFYDSPRTKIWGQ